MQEQSNSNKQLLMEMIADSVQQTTKISPGVFSRLYSSLETLDVNEITECVLSVPELRDAILTALRKRESTKETKPTKEESTTLEKKEIIKTSIPHITKDITASIPAALSGLPNMTQYLTYRNLPSSMFDYMYNVAANQLINQQYQQMLARSLLVSGSKPVSRPLSEGPSSNTSSPTPMTSAERMEESISVTEPREVQCPACRLILLDNELDDHLASWCNKTDDGMSVHSNEKMKEHPYKKENRFHETMNINYEDCPICSEPVPGTNLQQHIQSTHATMMKPNKHKFQCDQCLLSFKNKSTLKRHMITHTQGGGYSCQTCGKIFAKMELLRRHEQIHTEANRFLWPCPHCSKGFSNKYNLAVHERIHTGELPFACPHCNERFRVKCSMQNHMRSRHSEMAMFPESSTDLSTASTFHSRDSEMVTFPETN